MVHAALKAMMSGYKLMVDMLLMCYLSLTLLSCWTRVCVCVCACMSTPLLQSSTRRSAKVSLSTADRRVQKASKHSDLKQ